MLKLCSKCRQQKSLDSFARCSSRPDGRQYTCRECHRDYARERYPLVRQREIANAKAWNVANPERKAASNKRHRDKTKEICAERSRQWRIKNPGATLAIKAWRERHPDVVREYSLKRRSLLTGAPGFASAAQIAARVEFYGGRCWLCGGEANSIDHVIPVSRGGSNWPSNLRPACRHCNSAKGAKMVYVRTAV